MGCALLSEGLHHARQERDLPDGHVLPAATARIAVRRWYTRRSRVPLRRRSISFFCSAVNSIVFIAASSVRSFGGLALPHRLILPVGFPSATVYTQGPFLIRPRRGLQPGRPAAGLRER